MRPALKTLFPKAAMLMLAAVIAGCGFQLRGTSPVPAALQPLAVDCPESLPGDFCNSVRQQLNLGGVELVSEANADYVLHLRNYQQDRRASAITSRAVAAEYILRHSVTVELLTSDRIPLIAETDLSASETYRYDEDNVLAKQREEDTLRQQLGDRLAQQVIFRLAPMSQERIDAAIREHADSQENAEDQ
jgi:LPS-assembly lipoprotein